MIPSTLSLDARGSILKHVSNFSLMGSPLSSVVFEPRSSPVVGDNAPGVPIPIVASVPAITLSSVTNTAIAFRICSALPRGVATLSEAELGNTLAEPHPSWMAAIEAGWRRRYGTGS